jgi:hypothetical protein
MNTKPIVINALEDPDWLQKAKDALDRLRPIQLRGDEEQIFEFLNYKRSKAGKWVTEGILTIEPPIKS